MLYGDIYIAERTVLEKHHVQPGDQNERLPGLAVGKRLASPVMSWLGKRLVSWGSQLQEHSSHVPASPQPANHVLS